MNLEDMATTLQSSGDYRVLRRLVPRSAITPPDGSKTCLGVFLDVETTGLDHTKDEVIELAMMPFRYSLDGRIFEVFPAFQQLQQPSKPIPAEIVALTGITDEMVAGRVIEVERVREVADAAALVVAHNAAFDRPWADHLCDVFTTKPWACSMAQVDWRAEGYKGSRLSYLAAGAGFFYEGHRAVEDCAAAIELLARPLPRSGVLAFARLLECARRPIWRIWAENSPFDLKDILKGRGYRWNDGANGKPKAWFVDVDDASHEAEIAFLKAEIYQRDVDLLVRRITAYDRFSERC